MNIWRWESVGSENPDTFLQETGLLAALNGIFWHSLCEDSS